MILLMIKAAESRGCLPAINTIAAPGKNTLITTEKEAETMRGGRCSPWPPPSRGPVPGGPPLPALQLTFTFA